MSELIPNQNDDAAVTLRGIRVPLTSTIGCAFIADCSRNWEKLITNAEIQDKYGLSPEAWQQLGTSKPLKLAVQAEHERRIRNGVAAQESAAKLFAEAPAVLGKILNNECASPRHRIEAAKELRATARNTAETGENVGEKFTITINLGANEKLTFDKRINPTAPSKNLWEGSNVDEG
jgi:hypothetical protein